MNFSQAVSTCLGKYVTFSGRAQRSEFWFFVLFTTLGGIGLAIVDAAVFGFGPEDIRGLSGLFSLATFLPSISVAVRRLHDLNRSGWWWWLWLVPLIGWIILIIWYCTRGTDGHNQYGHDPLDPGSGGEDDRDFHRSSIPSVPRDD